jgi:hypothetical protein
LREPPAAVREPKFDAVIAGDAGGRRRLQVAVPGGDLAVVVVAGGVRLRAA